MLAPKSLASTTLDAHLRTVEGKAGGGIDWNCTSIRSLVGGLATVKLDGIELGLSGFSKSATSTRGAI